MSHLVNSFICNVTFKQVIVTNNKRYRSQSEAKKLGQGMTTTNYCVKMSSLANRMVDIGVVVDNK